MAAGSVTKFIFAVSAAFAAAISNDGRLLCIMLAAVLSAFFAWGGSIKNSIKIIKVASWFFLLVFLLHLFSGSGDALFRIWFLKATRAGVLSGMLYGLKLVIFVYCAYIIFFMVDPLELINPLERITKYAGRSGRYISSLLISFSLALRFLPDLSRQARTTLMAFRSRGIDFKGGMIKKVEVAGLLLVSIFVSTFKKAESVSIALVLKGYSLRYNQAVFPPVNIGLSGVFVVTVSICMIIAGWLSR